MCGTRGQAGDTRQRADEASILVVDDDRAVASLAESYLERLDEDVHVAVETVSPAAVERFERERVDLVVSDYEMPAIDGLELLTELRARDGDVPFVLFTSHGDERIARRARENGATYVHKDGDAGGFGTLVNRVEALLEDGRN